MLGPTQIRVYGKVGHLFEENYFLSDGMTLILLTMILHRNGFY